MESIEQTFNGTVGFSNRVTCQISRNGDLIHRMYLQTTITEGNVGTGTNVGLNLIKSVELEIGGQRIDKQYGDWMYIWNELSLPEGKKDGYNTMVGASFEQDSTRTLYIPLEFWFCRNPGLALPLIALQYHEVKVNIEFNTEASLGDGAFTLGTTSLWVDYIFLDTDERRRFAQLSHEYLIEQVQFTGEESYTTGGSKSFKLNFNHPVKELVWVSCAESNTFTYLPPGVAKLQLNGHDRFAERAGKYFTHVQPYQHHEKIPSVEISVYSFALKPEEHQPSGTLNFSRIDSAVLKHTPDGDATVTRIYATNYNVLRVMSGMGGLAYSN
jgi:hypothetical protein